MGYAWRPSRTCGSCTNTHTTLNMCHITGAHPCVNAYIKPPRTTLNGSGRRAPGSINDDAAQSAP